MMHPNHLFPDLPHDFPGENTELSPAKAPVWMHRLMNRIAEGHLRNPLAGSEGSGTTYAEKQAAVLMLFAGSETSFDLPNDASVLLTHRSPTMRSHSGQIAFPGGRIDPEDVNAVDCAFREAGRKPAWIVAPQPRWHSWRRCTSGPPVIPSIPSSGTGTAPHRWLWSARMRPMRSLMPRSMT